MSWRGKENETKEVSDDRDSGTKDGKKKTTHRSRVSRVRSLISIFRRSSDVLVEVVLGCGSGSSRSLGQSARNSDLKNRVGDESGPVEVEKQVSGSVEKLW